MILLGGYFLVTLVKHGGAILANHKSAAKRARQSLRIAKINTMRKGAVRTAEKTLKKAIEGKNTAEAQKLLIKFSSRIQKAVKTGVFHARTGSRKISRLAKQVHNLSQK